MDSAFERCTLHNFLWRTSLDRREVLENLFSTSFGGIKVVMVAPFFMVAPKISSFWLIFIEVFHSQGVDQAPNTSQDSSLTRWEPEQDYGGLYFSMSQVIFVV